MPEPPGRASLLGQRKYADAEPWLLQGYEGLKAWAAQRPAVPQPRLREAGARIVRLYEAWGQAKKAAEWKVRLGLADLPADVFAGP
jgi:hypothetical protein